MHNYKVMQNNYKMGQVLQSGAKLQSRASHMPPTAISKVQLSDERN